MFVSRSGCVFFLLTLAATARAQQTTIRVPVRAVVASTLVVSRQGRYVAGLEAKDFRLYDAGRLQQIRVDTEELPITAVVAVQTNRDTREYVPLVAKVCNLVQDSLAGQNGKMALISYNDEVSLNKSFADDDVRSAFGRLRADGGDARMIDAGLEAVKLLKQVPASSSRVLLFIGQALDHGSKTDLSALEEAVEEENILVYSLRLPEFGKAFVGDSLSLTGKDGSGIQAGIELTKIIPAMQHSAKVQVKKDPFALLSTSTGGVELSFRKQKQLEDALIATGASLRGRYSLSYSPDSNDPGYHKIQVQVDVPGAVVYTRPGYTYGSN